MKQEIVMDTKLTGFGQVIATNLWSDAELLDEMRTAMIQEKNHMCLETMDKICCKLKDIDPSNLADAKDIMEELKSENWKPTFEKLYKEFLKKAEDNKNCTEI